MNKYWLMIPLLILLISGVGYYLFSIPTYNSSISVHHWNYGNYLKEGYKENWKGNFSETVGMSYTELLGWINTKMKYPETETENEMLDRVFREKRSQESIWDDPVSIINGYPPFLIGNRSLGRCGEFSLSFLQALFVNNYYPNLIIGEHTLSDGSIGDHVWIELNMTDKLLIIDPTDACTWRDNNPDKPWNECSDIGYNPRLIQNVTWNSVWRITEETVVNVTEEYN